MLHALREVPSVVPLPVPAAPAPPAETACVSAAGRRPSPPRVRALFLRRFRELGEVRAAAKEAGVARSTLYRWREKDARFRARWETYDEMRRHEAEDHLVRLLREGEKTTAFHRGESVGWKVSFTVRPAVALLASQDRREKLRLREREWEAKRASVSHSGDNFSAESLAASRAWPREAPRKTARRDDDRVPTPESSPTPQPQARGSSHGRRVAQATEAEKPVPVSHSGGRFPAEKRAVSKPWSGKDRRKAAPLVRVPHRLQDDWGLPKAKGGRGIESLLLPRFGGGEAFQTS